MKLMKKFLVMICLCILATLVIPVVAPYDSYGITAEAATKVRLNKTKVTLTPGSKLQLKLSGANGKVIWKSSKKSVATVSSKGKVTAKKKGTAAITAKVENKKLTCKVTVKETYGSVSGNITYFYNSFRGNVPDTGSYVLLIPADGSAKKLKSISLYFGDEKNHIYQAKVDGTGRVNISHVACGKYLAFIVSKNTNSRTYYNYITGKISKDKYMKYYTNWLYPKYVSKSAAKSIAQLAPVGGQCYGEVINVYKNETTYISHDFGMTYF